MGGKWAKGVANTETGGKEVRGEERERGKETLTDKLHIRLWCCVVLGSVLPVQQMSVEGVPPKVPDDGFITQPKEGLICVQWYEPLLDKLVPAPDDSDPCIIMLYALATKSSRKRCGVRWIDPTELQTSVTTYVSVFSVFCCRGYIYWPMWMTAEYG